MRVALIFPPLASPTQPYSSLPALTAFLRTRGRHQVTQFDTNIEFTREILTRDALNAAAERIAERLHRLDGEKYVPPPADEVDLMTAAALKAPIVAESIDRAISDLRNRETFLDLARLDKAKRLVHDAFDVISASWYPVSLSGTDRLKAVPFTWSELDRWARNRKGNPFRSFFEERLVPRLLSLEPEAIGISITYESQLLATGTLCVVLKELLPKIPIVLGGQIVSSWYDRIEECWEVFEWCDFVVGFEAESALETLLSALQSKSTLDQVPNLVRRHEGRLVRNASSVEDIDALPTPDYQGLPLHLYLAPEPVFLLNTSRGCYWSRCSFCSVSPSMRGRHRARRHNLVMADIENVTSRYSSDCVMFGDDCVPPKTLARLAHDLLLTRTEISWQCQVRFESSLTSELLHNLSRAGCRNLTFGLESYAPRVLSLMNKGIRHAEIERILGDCRRFGIAFNLQLFFGFPGETEQEARQTIDFVLDQMHGAATCSFGLFRLLRGSKVEREPEIFGIHPLESVSSVPAERVEYLPQPEHAAEAKQQLRRQILRRMSYRHVAFSLDAHTLLFLHEAGIEKMARDYYRSLPRDRPEYKYSTNLPHRLVRKGNQTIATLPDPDGGGRSSSRIVVYDYDLDETIEVSQLAVWVLRQFDVPKAASDPGLQASKAAADSKEAHRLTSTVNHVVLGLFDRGLLVETD